LPRLPDDKRPEGAVVLWRHAVQVEDGDEGPQEGGGPLFKGLCIDAIE
jgi:hypothetical protein